MGLAMNGTGLTMNDALALARASPEGEQDPAVIYALETAINNIWSKVEAQPATYLMTQDEFAVFNYFQNRFQGNEVAIAARKRYWESLRP